MVATARNNWGQINGKRRFYVIRIQGHLTKSKNKDTAGPWGTDENQGLDSENPESHPLPTLLLFHSLSLKLACPVFWGALAANGLSWWLPGLPRFHAGDEQNEPGPSPKFSCRDSGWSGLRQVLTRPISEATCCPIMTAPSLTRQVREEGTDHYHGLAFLNKR